MMKITQVGTRLPATADTAPSPGSQKKENELQKLENEIASFSRKNRHKFWEADGGWRNFRVHPAGKTGESARVIQVSGSSEPSPEDLEYLAKEKSVDIIVDLREEPHGYVKSPSLSSGNWVAVSYTNRGNWPNPRISKKKLMKKEERLFQDAKNDGNIFLVFQPGALKEFSMDEKKISRKEWKGENVKILDGESEWKAIKIINKGREASRLPDLEYYRVPITDELPPDPHDVDKLVKIYRHALREGKNIHFHCEAGRGRTTTAMALTQIMDGKSVEQALDDESNENPLLDGNGKDLREIKVKDVLEPLLVKAAALRLGMLYKFHAYWNSREKETMSFQDYMKGHPIDRSFLTEVAGILKITPNPESEEIAS